MPNAAQQAFYINALKEAALQKVLALLNEGKKLSFDPQGRVLITVEPYDLALNEGQLDGLVWNFEKSTVVSLDVQADQQLVDAYNVSLREALEREECPENSRNILIEANTNLLKGSIIALQQEFHFHLALTSRVYESVRKLAGKEEEVHEALQAAQDRVNELVMKAYAKALMSAQNADGSINIAQLNKVLDKARKKIAPQAHTIFRNEIIAHTGVVLTKKDLKEKVGNETLKHIAEKKTATPHHLLHFEQNGLAILIEGSENTAHNRVEGEQFAHRQIITQWVNDGIVEENRNDRIQIRTPSPVVKKGLANDDAYIHDVALKLNHITTTYRLYEQAEGGPDGKPKAFIYNSYTAFNDILFDERKNLQTQSAIHILRGAHEYNANQFLNSQDPVFCFVQNISVNGFGSTLGYDSGNELQTETTLMAELALLHTLYDSSPDQQALIDQVFTNYKTFLGSNPRPAYFFQSDRFQETRNQIGQIKAAWRETCPEDPSDDMLINARQGLKNLIANDVHLNSHEYAKLIQALSVFVEKVSIGGCKSANERAQAINGRVAIFDRALNHEDGEISLRVSRLAVNDLNAAAQLKNALDTEYNRQGLQGGATLISLADQGASAKIEAKPNHPFYFSRNKAEEPAMTNLQQAKAGRMQAHKELTNLMSDAWEGYPRSWWSRMCSSPLGLIGGLLGTVVVFPAVIVAGVNLIANYMKKQKANKEMEEAVELYHSHINVNPALANLGHPVAHAADVQLELDDSEDEDEIKNEILPEYREDNINSPVEHPHEKNRGCIIL